MRGKGEVGELIDVQPETFGGGLEEVSISGGALRVELEVFYAAVVEDDDFDILAADVHDHVWVFVEFQGGFRVGYGFHQGDVGLQNIF